MFWRYNTYAVGLRCSSAWDRVLGGSVDFASGLSARLGLLVMIGRHDAFG